MVRHCETRQTQSTKQNTGQLLAVADGEGFLKLLETESYKPVHKTRPIQNWEDIKITCIGWVSNCTKKLEGSAQDDTKSPWKDLLAKYSDDKENRALDLPRDLAAIEIESSMPKLPVLAIGSSSYATHVSLVFWLIISQGKFISFSRLYRQALLIQEVRRT
jgi:anaphase-promoting complex subunit 4